MPKREFHYRWEWQLQSSPEALWPLVSDTNRFNRETGLPSVKVGAARANAYRELSMRRLGMLVAWEEEPFEWIRPERFGVVRRYHAGPVARMRTLTELFAEPGGGSRAVYQVWISPRNLLGLVAIPLQVGLISARSFEAAFRRYDSVAAAAGTARPAAIPRGGARSLAPSGLGRMTAAHQALLKRRADADLVNRLIAFVERADDLTVSRIRPYAPADQ